MHAVTLALILSIVALVAGVALYLWAERDRRISGNLMDYIGGAACVAAVAVFCFGVAAGVAAGGSISCERKADNMDRDWRYGLMSGCLVQSDDGLFVPLDNLRITSEERG